MRARFLTWNVTNDIRLYNYSWKRYLTILLMLASLPGRQRLPRVSRQGRSYPRACCEADEAWPVYRRDRSESWYDASETRWMHRSIYYKRQYLLYISLTNTTQIEFYKMHKNRYPWSHYCDLTYSTPEIHRVWPDGLSFDLPNCQWQESISIHRR